MTYNVDGVLPADLVSGFDDGTNLLLSGAAMSGKRDLLLRLLARGDRDGEGAVLVTSRDPAEEVLREYDDAVAGAPGFLRAVDCVSAQSGSTTGGDAVRYVSSPGDLTGMGIEFSEIAREAGDAGVGRLRVGFDSLSPLLMYVDLQRLFRFLHVFTSQIQSQGWLGVFSVDPESHDDQTINTISQLFDGVLQVRVTDGGDHEVRVRGVSGTPSEWTVVERPEP
ncbi:RAD55 family ATPase [Halobacterium yunchengense]|uniref:RAD55 family ATPase n=1 Tax=Halobacterium yunchengense TaxID=3108497 RepID=UPI0030088D51